MIMSFILINFKWIGMNNNYTNKITCSSFALAGPVIKTGVIAHIKIVYGIDIASTFIGLDAYKIFGNITEL